MTGYKNTTSGVSSNPKLPFRHSSDGRARDRESTIDGGNYFVEYLKRGNLVAVNER